MSHNTIRNIVLSTINWSQRPSTRARGSDREKGTEGINYFLDEDDKTNNTAVLKLTFERNGKQKETKQGTQKVIHRPLNCARSTHFRLNPTSLVYNNKLLPMNKIFFTARNCFSLHSRVTIWPKCNF